MTRVLLVADAEWVTNDVSAAVTDPTVEIIVVEDADSALEALQERPFETIIVDMQVKNMGGMATVRHLKDAMALERVSRTPILLLLDRTADVFLAKRAGAAAHLVKPFTSQDLRSALVRLLPA